MMHNVEWRKLDQGAEEYIPPPATYSKGERWSRCFGRCGGRVCCSVCFVIVSLLIFIVAVSAVVFLVLRPKAPKFEITSASLDDFWISNSTTRLFSLRALLNPLTPSLPPLSSSSVFNSSLFNSSLPNSPLLNSTLSNSSLNNSSLTNFSSNLQAEGARIFGNDSTDSFPTVTGIQQYAQDLLSTFLPLLPNPSGLNLSNMPEGVLKNASGLINSTVPPSFRNLTSNNMTAGEAESTISAMRSNASAIVEFAKALSDGLGSLTQLLEQDRTKYGEVLERLGLLLDVNGSFAITSDNPNAVDIDFGQTKMELFISNQSLANVTIAPFDQEAKSKKNISALVVARGLRVGSKIGQAILDAFVNNSMNLELKITVQARVRRWFLSSPKVSALVNCIIVIDPSLRKMKDKKCQIKQFKVFTWFGTMGRKL